MRTLRDMNMSKFVAEDVPLFLALIDDLFPGVRAERASFPEVTAALEKASEKPTTIGFIHKHECIIVQPKAPAS